MQLTDPTSAPAKPVDIYSTCSLNKATRHRRLGRSTTFLFHQVPRMATTIFKNIRLFDGNEVHQSATVVVKDGKISSVTTSMPSNVDTSATTIDGAGHTLLPGLIESHMHAHLLPGKGTLLETTGPGGWARRLTRCWSVTNAINRARNPETSNCLRYHNMSGHAQHTRRCHTNQESMRRFC